MKHEIRTVKMVGDNYEPCDETDPNAVWGLYEIGADNLPMYVSDHATQAEAQSALALTSKPDASEQKG